MQARFHYLKSLHGGEKRKESRASITVRRDSYAMDLLLRFHAFPHLFMMEEFTPLRLVFAVEWQ